MNCIYLLLQSVQCHTKTRVRQQIVVCLFFLLIEFLFLFFYIQSLASVRTVRTNAIIWLVCFICLEVVHVSLQPLQPVPQTKMYP